MFAKIEIFFCHVVKFLQDVKIALILLPSIQKKLCKSIYQLHN